MTKKKTDLPPTYLDFKHGNRELTCRRIYLGPDAGGYRVSIAATRTGVGVVLPDGSIHTGNVSNHMSITDMRSILTQAASLLKKAAAI